MYKYIYIYIYIYVYLYIYGNVVRDISEFYPSISEELLEKSINFAKSTTNIDDSTIQIIKHARKLLFFDCTGIRVKNDDNALFDATMGSFECAEACEFVGFYLLSKISVHNGLYRDGGLAVLTMLMVQS